MTEQEVVELLSSIHFNQSLDMTSYFIVIICAGIGGWLASYLKEKGKNYAKREDFVGLQSQLEQNTNLIEGIRTQLSEKSWINQQVWVKKQEAYEAIFSSLFHIRKYVAHQVSDYEEWEYINYYHPLIQGYGIDDSEKYFESWEREKEEYERKSKDPETKKEAEKLKTKYEEAIIRLFEIIEVKSIYLDKKVGITIKELKSALTTTNDYEEWGDHFNRVSRVTTASIENIRQICRVELKIDT